MCHVNLIGFVIALLAVGSRNHHFDMNVLANAMQGRVFPLELTLSSIQVLVLLLLVPLVAAIQANCLILPLVSCFRLLNCLFHTLLLLSPVPILLQPYVSNVPAFASLPYT